MKFVCRGILLFVALICILMMTSEARRRKNGRRRGVKLRERRAELKENGDGTIEFPRELQYTMKVDGENDCDLNLILNPYMQLPDDNVARRQKYAFYTDVNTGHSFACKVRRRNGKVKCDVAGLLEREGETCYISPVSGMAECESTDDFTDGQLLVLDDNYQRVNHSSELFTQTPTERRRKRSILPDPGFQAVEIAFVVDEAFMSPFYDRNPDDDDAAVEEAELYVTLLANEMSVFYSSVKEVSGGALDLVIYPSAFRHPGKNNNFPWSQNNIINGDNLNIDDALSNFNTYRLNELQGVQYDHVMGISGLDLFVSDIGTSLLGVAFVGTVCRRGSPAVSLQENIGLNLGWVASHELGHALGSGHDQTSECPTATNLMSASLFFPDQSTRESYSRFSTCSVDQFISHLNRQSDDCTANSGFTDVQFEAAFCSGLLGASEMSLDRQCQIRTGSSTASACSTVVNSNGCHLANQISCRSTPQGSCSTRLLFVWNGTPCGTNSFCFKGNCVPEFNICPAVSSTSTAAPTTQAPTTQAPTTQAPTTQAPTTQAPTTQAPTTQAPTTQAPTTEAPTTQAPTTQAPTTQAPTTQAPTTETPTTQAPTTETPTTQAPTTQAPTTQTPTTRAPTTQAPTTEAPTTQAPTTQTPMTQAPTTQSPTTEAPTTQAPTTQAPTTQAPTTEAPTTQGPTTQAPTTQAPTTQLPTTQPSTTQAPTTQAPTTQAPTTQAPTTQGQTTQTPSTTLVPTSATTSVIPPDGRSSTVTTSPDTTTTTSSPPSCSCCRIRSRRRRGRCCRRGYNQGLTCSCCRPLVTRAPANPNTRATSPTTPSRPTCTCCRFGGRLRRYCCRVANFYGKNCLCC